MDLRDGVAVVILAAGMGTRMRSTRAKVLHEVRGTPMIFHVARTASAVAGCGMVVVVGHQAEAVQAVVEGAFDARFALQSEQLGTGHAVRCAIPHLPDDTRQVVVLCGDVPLLRPETIDALVADHLSHRRHVTVLTVTVEDPTGYGRMILDAGRRITAIVEQADATTEQLAIRTINTGIYCVARDVLDDLLAQIAPNNAQGEYYLTDIVEIGHRNGLSVGAQMGLDAGEVVGVNTVEDLRTAEKILKNRCPKTA
ncbi:MAG: NTP transferase domain-containing protein [Desulfobacterales bacterium]|nr:NTP transferase domain-containing protein [Desulfobacterales bacterium]